MCWGTATVYRPKPFPQILGGSWGPENKQNTWHLGEWAAQQGESPGVGLEVAGTDPGQCLMLGVGRHATYRLPQGSQGEIPCRVSPPPATCHQHLSLTCLGDTTAGSFPCPAGSRRHWVSGWNTLRFCLPTPSP